MARKQGHDPISGLVLDPQAAKGVPLVGLERGVQLTDPIQELHARCRLLHGDAEPFGIRFCVPAQGFTGSGRQRHASLAAATHEQDHDDTDPTKIDA